MRNGTMYAARLKKVYAALRETTPVPAVPEPDEPLRRLALAILGENCTDEEADHALGRAFEVMVDWNDVRVSSAVELNRATGNVIPGGIQRCQQLIDALQAVFDRENRMSLDRLRSLGRREARHYLEQLDGTDEYVVASVLLWSLGGHAIPVNDRLLSALREADMIHATASRAEVQAFLERNIGATEAREFCLVMRLFVSTRHSGGDRVASGATAKREALRNHTTGPHHGP